MCVWLRGDELLLIKNKLFLTKKTDFFFENKQKKKKMRLLFFSLATKAATKILVPYDLFIFVVIFPRRVKRRNEKWGKKRNSAWYRVKQGPKNVPVLRQRVRVVKETDSKSVGLARTGSNPVVVEFLIFTFFLEHYWAK